MFTPGVTYLLHMPAGWIIVGKATGYTTGTGYTLFENCEYIERIGDGCSALSSLPSAETREQFFKAAKHSYRVGQPMHIKNDSIMFFLPCKLDAAKLY